MHTFFGLSFALFFWFCRPRSGRLHPREAAGEKPGDPHKQRLCEGFIFLKIFLKSSQVFSCFVFYSVYFSAYYICTGKRKADSPPNPFSPVFFIFSRRDGCSPAGIVPGVVAVSFFVEKKEKKKKKRKWRGSVSKKERYFSRFKFYDLVCRGLKCDFGKARLPKLFTRNFRQEKRWFYYGQLSTQRQQKVYTFMRHRGGVN